MSQDILELTSTASVLAACVQMSWCHSSQWIKIYRWQGDFYNSLEQLRNSKDEGENFCKIMRMTVDQFNQLQERIKNC